MREVVPELFEIQLCFNEKLDDLGVTLEFVVESCHHDFQKDAGSERVFLVVRVHPFLKNVKNRCERLFL